SIWTISKDPADAEPLQLEHARFVVDGEDGRLEAESLCGEEAPLREPLVLEARCPGALRGAADADAEADVLHGADPRPEPSRFLEREALKADEDGVVLEAFESSLDGVATRAFQLDHHADP